MQAPLITIDGPSASGKSTLACKVAWDLGFGVLLSGFLYRFLAFSHNLETKVPEEAWNDENAYETVQYIFGWHKVEFSLLGREQYAVLCDGQQKTECLQRENIGKFASTLSKKQKVRQALLPVQHSYHRQPGLVAEGRDMGSVVFGSAKVKIYLRADLNARVGRRARQLKRNERGILASYGASLRASLKARDVEDEERKHSPLCVAKDAVVLDSTHKSSDQLAQEVLKIFHLETEGIG